MKIINGVLTVKREEIAIVLDAVVFMEQSFLRSTGAKENIQAALNSPEEKEKMLRTIDKLLDLNRLVSQVEKWPKDCHFSKPFSKEMDDMINRMDREEFFEMLVTTKASSTGKTILES